MGDANFCTVFPGNGVWRPISVVVFDICPTRLALMIVGIEATSHMDAELFELLVGELLRVLGKSGC